MTANTPTGVHPRETDWSAFVATAAAVFLLISLIRSLRTRVHDGRSKAKSRPARLKAVAKKARKKARKKAAKSTKARQRRPERGRSPRRVVTRAKRSSSAPGEDARNAHARR